MTANQTTVGKKWHAATKRGKMETRAQNSLIGHALAARQHVLIIHFYDVCVKTAVEITRSVRCNKGAWSPAHQVQVYHIHSKAAIIQRLPIMAGSRASHRGAPVISRDACLDPRSLLAPCAAAT